MSGQFPTLDAGQLFSYMIDFVDAGAASQQKFSGFLLVCKGDGCIPAFPWTGKKGGTASGNQIDEQSGFIPF